MNKEEKTLKENLIYDGKIIKLYNDDVLCPNDMKATREYIVHPGGVCILPIIGEYVLLIKQYRYAYRKELYELPAGKLEKGEAPIEAAKRELEEETGYKADNFISLGHVYPTCGYTNEVIHLFAAEVTSKGDSHPDADEFVETELIKLEDLVRMIKNDGIKDAKTVIAVLKYINFIKNKDKVPNINNI